MTNKVYVLRTCHEDMTAHGGFKWPENGYVEAPDWRANACCGNGLHGLLWGAGNTSLLIGDETTRKWLVVEVDSDSIIDLNGKVKFPRGEVIFCGNRDDAISAIINRGADASKCCFATLTGGDGSTLTGGDSSTLTGGYYSTLTGGYGSALTGGYGSTLTGGYGSALTGGDRSTLTGGLGSTLTGGYGSTLTGGNGSTLTGGDNSTLTGGDDSTLTGGDDSALTGGDRSTLTGGDNSTLTGRDGSTLTGGNRSTLTGGNRSTLTGGNYSTLTGRDGSTLTGGNRSTLIFKYWDSDKQKYRVLTAEVGENGIEPNKPYFVYGKTVKMRK